MAQRIIDKFSKEELKEIVETSQSYYEISIRLGYSKSTNAKKQIEDKCKEFGISLDKIDSSSKVARKVTLDMIFTENSTVSQNTLKRWYKKGEYIEYKCSICGLEPYWNGAELTLILDHINGNNRDNRLENLRWVCPNCDHQLPTFCSKNINYSSRISKNYCVDCGKEIDPTATRCNKCKGIYLRKIERPEKEDLYNQLIELNGNFTQIGKKYGVTDNTIRKWAKSYGLSTYSSDYKKPKKEKQLTYQYKVQQVDIKTGEVINTFNSCSEAEKKLGIHHVTEASNPEHSRKSAGGYYWKRIETICLTK